MSLQLSYFAINWIFCIGIIESFYNLILAQLPMVNRGNNKLRAQTIEAPVGMSITTETDSNIDLKLVG